MQESRLTVDSSMRSLSSFPWCFSLSCRITPDELPQSINPQYPHFCMAQSDTGYFTVTLTSLIASIHNSSDYIGKRPLGFSFELQKAISRFSIFASIPLPSLPRSSPPLLIKGHRVLHKNMQSGQSRM